MSEKNGMEAEDSFAVGKKNYEFDSNGALK